MIVYINIIVQIKVGQEQLLLKKLKLWIETIFNYFIKIVVNMLRYVMLCYAIRYVTLFESSVLQIVE